MVVLVVTQHQDVVGILLGGEGRRLLLLAAVGLIPAGQAMSPTATTTGYPEWMITPVGFETAAAEPATLPAVTTTSTLSSTSLDCNVYDALVARGMLVHPSIAQSRH